MLYRASLSIGISNYHASCHQLSNPKRDAEAVHEVLIQRGFASSVALDATSDELEKSLIEFENKVSNLSRNRNAFCIIYFAGHGVEVNGAGFLLPADFPSTVTPSSLNYIGIPVLRLINSMAKFNGPKIIIIDACRVPIHAWSPAEISTFADLVTHTQTTYKEATNLSDVLIAYSTSPGQMAFDGKDGNSLYCKKLCSAILKHDWTVEEAFSQVTQELINDSRMAQRPWYTSTISRRIKFSDLPIYRSRMAIPSRFEPHHGTRLHFKTSDDSFIYHTSKAVFYIKNNEQFKYIKNLEKPIQALTSCRDSIYILHPDGELLILESKEKEIKGRSFATKFTDAFGLEVSPSKQTIVVYGPQGYSIFRINSKNEAILLQNVGIGQDIYSARFFSNEKLFLCGSNGIIRGININKTGSLSIKDTETQPAQPIYDLAILEDGKTLVASCALGIIRFFNANNLKQTTIASTGSIGGNLSEAYNCLRDAGFSPEEAEEFAEDPLKFEQTHADKPDYIENIKSNLYSNDLICCTPLGDSRIFAVGTSDGYVFVIDARNGEIYQTLDAGGGRNISLQWVCASPKNGTIAVLSRDGTVLRFEKVTPPF